ncbi:hypothetical protein OHA19_10495 [Streptomyces sp. NBC_00012]|uniref:hypothetical protein n=1 Tax=Streptomyces sp. NBC_00012 TaxID=2975621 RepID=UPI00324F9B25
MDDENVITFRARDGAAPPGLPPLPSAPPATTTAPPPPPGTGAVAVAERPRQSSDAALAALAPARAPMPPALSSPVPATFRSEGLDDGPHDGQPLPLGALSLSAILAVALAALRGTVGFVQDWRQRRMERAAEEAAWRQARVKRRAAEEDALAAAAKVPSSAEFGRKAVRDGRKGAGPGPQGKSGGPHGTAPGGSGKTPRAPEKKPERRHDHPKPQEKRPKGPGSPSDGVVSPRRGKGGQGGPDKSALGRIRDRKQPPRTEDPKPEHKHPKKPQKSPKGPGGDLAKDRKRGPKSGQTGPTSQDQRQGKGRPDGPGPKKKPGIRHGTPEGHDAHGCRCVRCRRAARRRDEAAKAKAKGPEPSAPGGRDRKRRERPGKKKRRQQDTGSGTPPQPGPGGRRSADEDLRSSSAHADTETVVTLERLDRPDGQERTPTPAAAVTTGVRGLPRAPEQPAGARPGTTPTSTSTKEQPMAGSLPGTFTLGQDMDPEHQTEVTLDGVLDHLTKSKDQCFRTYDECADLADAARKLRRALEKVLDDLQGRHNVRGRLTRAAAAKLAECMDVMARKAEDMRTKSLLAAESVELAHDAMADAYRPVQEATADAGLAAPSARIHNED